MTSSKLHGIIVVIAITLSVMRTMNGAWIATNTSYFCEIANDCIKSEAESAMVVYRTVNGKNAKRACTAHKLYCNQSPFDNPDDMSSTVVPILYDKKAFCHVVVSCYPMVDVSKWCPYAHFCNQPPSADTDNGNNRTTRHSCCIHCSCAPTCGRTNDCCYGHNASYNAIESEELKCISFDAPVYKSVGFYMRDTCLNGSTCLYSREQITPASSQEKQRIYINKKCALCNEAYDVIEWEILSLCKGILTDCKQVVQLPETVDFRLIESYICSGKVIKTCDPRYRNEAVINLCHTVNATVLIPQPDVSMALYANIYCVACNFNSIYDPEGYCELFQVPPLVRTGDFAMLIDTNLDRIPIQDLSQITGNGDKCPGYMMNAIEKPKCRRIICPEEMIRVKDGSCQYYAKLWYRSRVVLHVKLIPLEGVTVHASILRNISSKSNINTWMRSPCLSSEDENTEYGVAIVTSGVAQEELVVEIAVQIRHAKADITPATFIPSLAKCFDHSWTLVVGVKKYAFSPSIFPNYEIPIVYEPIYQIATTVNCIVLQKYFFCNQIELNAEEWEKNGDQLRVLHNNITLSKTEFQNEHGQIRICVEDYQLMTYSGDTVVQIRFSVLITCIWLVQIVHH